MQKKSERYRLARRKKNWNPRGWILKGDFETLKKEQRLLVNGLLAKAGWWLGRSDGFRNLLLPDCEQETSLRRLPPRLQLLRLDPPRLPCQGINIRCVWLSHEMKVGGNIKVNQSHVSSFLFRVPALVRSLLRRHESPQDGLRLLAGGKIYQIKLPEWVVKINKSVSWPKYYEYEALSCRSMMSLSTNNCDILST